MPDNPISAARESIGKDQPNDYELKPIDHPREFQEKAPKLFPILNSARATTLAQQYLAKDIEAGTAQKRFKRVFGCSNLMVLVTAFLISAVLAVGILFPGQQAPVIVVSVLTLISGAVATYCLNVLRQGRLLECWMSQRARAELKRAEYFSQIAKQELKGDDPNHEADLLRLEYFRRYQLGIQLNFYNGRSKDHARDARQALAISSFAIAGASLLTALSGTALSSYAHGKFTALAAFGAAFTALASFATVRESVFQYQRNADRYEKTGEILGGMLATMDEVREAVRQAGQPPLLEFVNAVQEQLSLEHRQWLGAADEQNKALEQLKANLADVMKKAAEKKDEKAKGQTPPAST